MQVDAILKDIPGVDRRSVITGYSPIDGGFKTNAATSSSRSERLRQNATRRREAKAAERARDPHRLRTTGQAHRARPRWPIAPPAIPASARRRLRDSGSRTPPRRPGGARRADGRPSSPGRATARARAAEHTTFNARLAPAARRRRPREDDATAGRAPIQDVYSAIQAQFGSLTASQFNQFSRVWWVIVQSDARSARTRRTRRAVHAQQPEQDGAAVGGGDDRVDRRAPDLRMPHFNGFPAAVKVIGNAPPGFSSGQAISRDGGGRRELPPNYAFAWSGLAFEESQSGGTRRGTSCSGSSSSSVLAAQYERSWTLPAR